MQSESEPAIGWPARGRLRGELTEARGGGWYRGDGLSRRLRSVHKITISAGEATESRGQRETHLTYLPLPKSLRLRSSSSSIVTIPR